MVNKKVVIICSIIALIVVGAIVGIEIKKLKETDYSEEVGKQNNLENQNVTQNEVKNDVQSENTIQENEVNTENTVTENTTQNQVQGEEETKPEKEDTQGNKSNENNKDKALKLVQEEWGEDDTVYYTIDNQSNNTYNISVRSKSTTETLAEYEVDVEDETVVIK